MLIPFIIFLYIYQVVTMLNNEEYNKLENLIKKYLINVFNLSFFIFISSQTLNPTPNVFKNR